MDRRYRANMAPERIRIAQDALTKVTQWYGTVGMKKRLKSKIDFQANGIRAHTRPNGKA